jgi:hypothetical protein
MSGGGARAHLVGDAEAKPSHHRWVAFRIEVTVDQDKSLVDPDRTENIGLAARHGPVQGLVQVVKAKAQCEVVDGDVGYRHRQPNRLADRVLLF